jgi:hypothetical protein
VALATLTEGPVTVTCPLLAGEEMIEAIVDFLDEHFRGELPRPNVNWESGCVDI